MSMTAGASRGLRAEINITPMIDILLVLIIAFLVIQPEVSHGLRADVPEESDSGKSRSENTIVVTVLPDGLVRLNQDAPIPFLTLESQLYEQFKNSTSDAIFVRGEGSLDFQRFADVIDTARHAGVKKVGLMTR